ncbi:Uncharacterized protein APZ42_005020, partial [Daphnia magna]
EKEEGGRVGKDGRENRHCRHRRTPFSPIGRRAASSVSTKSSAGEVRECGTEKSESCRVNSAATDTRRPTRT